MSTHITAYDLSLTAPARCETDGVTEVLDTSKLRGHERWRAIREWVLEPLGGNDLVAIEGYAYGARGRAMVSLGELGGIVRMALHDAGIKFIEVTPGSIKKYATGKGNASKDEVLLAAARRGGELFEGDTNDEADAFMLWAAVMDALGDPVIEMPAKHREALDVIKDSIDRLGVPS